MSIREEYQCATSSCRAAAPHSIEIPSLDTEEECTRPTHSTVRRCGRTLGHLSWGPEHCEGVRNRVLLVLVPWTKTNFPEPFLLQTRIFFAEIEEDSALNTFLGCGVARSGR